MSDNKDNRVEVELLASSSYVDGTDKVRGDVVLMDPDQAKRLEAEGLVGPKGTLERIAKEREEADRRAAERAEEQQRLDDEEARIRQAHAQNRPAATVTTETADTEPSGSSEDGTKVEKRDSTRRR